MDGYFYNLTTMSSRTQGTTRVILIRIYAQEKAAFQPFPLVVPHSWLEEEGYQHAIRLRPCILILQDQLEELQH